MIRKAKSFKEANELPLLDIDKPSELFIIDFIKITKVELSESIFCEKRVIQDSKW